MVAARMLTFLTFVVLNKFPGPSLGIKIIGDISSSKLQLHLRIHSFLFAFRIDLFHF